MVGIGAMDGQPLCSCPRSVSWQRCTGGVCRHSGCSHSSSPCRYPSGAGGEGRSKCLHPISPFFSHSISLSPSFSLLIICLYNSINVPQICMLLSLVFHTLHRKKKNSEKLKCGFVNQILHYHNPTFINPNPTPKKPHSQSTTNTTTTQTKSSSGCLLVKKGSGQVSSSSKSRGGTK